MEPEIKEETCENKVKSDKKMENNIDETTNDEKKNLNPNTESKVMNGNNTQRRNDEPSELSFEKCTAISEIVKLLSY